MEEKAGSRESGPVA